VFYIALDQHDIYVIETDGIEVEPYKLDVITISVAQRYSILVTAKNETGVNYAMSIMQAEEMYVSFAPSFFFLLIERLMGRYDIVPEGLVLNNTVQIVYDDLNEPASKVVVAGWPVLDDTDFVPVLQREMAPADIEYELNVWFDVRLFHPLCSIMLMIRHTMMGVIEDHSIMCMSPTQKAILIK
jgi:iron transport multicopper oxidase